MTKPRSLFFSKLLTTKRPTLSPTPARRSNKTKKFKKLNLKIITSTPSTPRSVSVLPKAKSRKV
jgi:hypothetical protein